ncbi:hypothetical protein EJB05_33712, partial [Eragrostis curvula]
SAREDLVEPQESVPPSPLLNRETAQQRLDTPSLPPSSCIHFLLPRLLLGSGQPDRDQEIKLAGGATTQSPSTPLQKENAVPPGFAAASVPGEPEKGISASAMAPSKRQHPGTMTMTVDTDYLDCGICNHPLKPPIF